MPGGRWIGGSKTEDPEPREDRMCQRVGGREAARTRPKVLTHLGTGCPEMETQRGKSTEARSKGP